MTRTPTDGALVPKRPDERPEFTTVPLAVDLSRAGTIVAETLPGLSATLTPDGLRLRTTDGVLVAVLTADRNGIELRYRTAPAPMPATRKARKLRRALEPYAE